MLRLLLLSLLIYFSFKVFRRFLVSQISQNNSNPFFSNFQSQRPNQSVKEKLNQIEDADFTEIIDETKQSDQ